MFEYLLRLSSLILTIFMLVACASLGTQQSDLIKVKAEALQAYHQGKLTLAEHKFKMIIEAVPSEAEAWFRLGNIYARTHRPALAIEAYQQTLLLEPKQHKAWHNMGTVHLRQAANAFTQLLNQIDINDPLYTSAEQLHNNIINLLNTDMPDAARSQHHKPVADEIIQAIEARQLTDDVTD